MNILLVPIGSHGDVHPFIGIGLALRARGHRARVIVNPFFGSLVEKAGLELIPLGTADYYTRMAGRRDLWHPIKGPRLVFASLAELLRPVYEAIVANTAGDETIVVASSLALGARVAQDRHAIPTATVHLQPTIFRSFVDPSKLRGMWLGPQIPRWLMKLQWSLVDRMGIDPLIAPALNAFRAEVGLAPVKYILRDYIHSPQCTIGLFPAWFAPPQPDWPAQARLTGFPLYDEQGVSGLSDELLRFLDTGDKPIAFTFGSAMWHAHEQLEQSARACTLLGRRGILLTRHLDQVPKRLPADVKHIDYAPLSMLLKRCAALVHHGGIGTASQGLAAGVPQLVQPHTHDQPDNASRMEALGVAKVIPPRQYQADKAAQRLADLLGDAAIAKNCDSVARLFAGSDAMGETCGLIEELAQK